MDSVETKFQTEVNLCFSHRDHDHGALIETARSFLNKSLSSQKGNYQKAASLLAASTE